MIIFDIHAVKTKPSLGIPKDWYAVQKPNGRFELFIANIDGELFPAQGVSDDELIRIGRLTSPLLTKLEELDDQESIDYKIDNAIVNSTANLISVPGTVLPRGADVPSYITNIGKAELLGGNSPAGTTYTNTGQAAPNNEFHIPQGSIGYAFYNKTTNVWTLNNIMELPQGIVPVKDILTSNSVTDALSANQGRVLKEDMGVIANVKDSIDVVASTARFQDTSVIYNSGTFSAWSSITVPAQNFDSVKLFIRSHDINVPITKIRVQLRENNFEGAILGDVTFDYDFNGDTINEHEIIATFSSVIANPNNSPICVLYLTNGNASCRGLYILGAELKYLTTKVIDPVPNFVNTTPNPDRKIYVEFGNVFKDLSFSSRAVEEIKNNFEDEFRGGEMSNEVFEDSLSLLEDRYSTSIGTDVWTNESSTFNGWGQLLPVVDNFNGIKLKIRSWDITDPITSVRVLLREGDRDGAIIIDETVPFTGNVGEEKDVIITFPLYENVNSSRIWVEYNTDGKVGRLRTGTSGIVGETVRYRTTSSAGTTFADSSASDVSKSVFHAQLGIFEQKLKVKNDFLTTLKEQLDLDANAGAIPESTIPSEIYVAQGLESNIYFDNAFIPLFGDKLDNYSIDVNGTKGRHFEKFHRFTPVSSDVGSYALSLMLYKGTSLVRNITTNLKVASLNSGNGVTRSIIIAGDSTVDPNDITKPLTEYFATDVMNIECKGTRGPDGMKNEGVSGGKISDIATIGRTLYRFYVTGLADNPGVDSIYTNNSSSFKVVEINITGGNGYFSCERTSGTNVPIPTASTLVKTSGVGPNNISYNTSEVTSQNKFWNPILQKFDFNHYLTENSITMLANDWFMFQYGINDVFGLTDAYTAQLKTEEMWAQLLMMMDDIQTVVPNIRIGVAMTIPPAHSQDAFGFNYSNNQSRERYMKTGWIAWHKKLLAEMNNAANRTARRYLIPIHLNLDTVNNFPKALYDANARNTEDKVLMWNNGVHPSLTGYSQMADAYIGAIKYFG